MKVHTKEVFEWFYDPHQRQWVVYPVDAHGERIEWDAADNPIECKYFNNRRELSNWLDSIN